MTSSDSRIQGKVGRGGYTQPRNAVMWDTSISLAARAVHVLFLDLAWQATGENREDVYVTQLDFTVEKIAAMAGCSVGSLRGYVGELREAGLVQTVRASPKAKLLWEIRRVPRTSDPDGVTTSDSDVPRAILARVQDSRSKTDDYVVVADGQVGEFVEGDCEVLEGEVVDDDLELDELLAGIPHTPGQREEWAAAHRENPAGFERCVADARWKGDAPVALLTSMIRCREHVAEKRRRGLTPEEMARFPG